MLPIPVARTARHASKRILSILPILLMLRLEFQIACWSCVAGRELA